MTPEVLFGTAKQGWALIADSILMYPKLQKSSKILKQLRGNARASLKLAKDRRLAFRLQKKSGKIKSECTNLVSPVKARSSGMNSQLERIDEPSVEDTINSPKIR